MELSHCVGLLATDVGFGVEGSLCWDLIQHSEKGNCDCYWITGHRTPVLLVNMTSDSVDVNTIDGIFRGGMPCTVCSALLLTAHSILLAAVFAE